MSSQSTHMPKFGDWDESQSQFTLIFDNVRANKSMKKSNPNDPAFLAELLNSSSASQGVHDVDSPPRQPPLQHGSPPKPSSIDHKNQSPHVPKSGECDIDGENRVEQPYTTIFDQMRVDKDTKGFNPNDPEFLARFARALSQSSGYESSQSPSKHVSRSSTNHKSPSTHVPKFGDWDGDGEEQQFTLIFNNMHAIENKEGFNPNDPESLKDLIDATSTSPSSTDATVHSVNQPPTSPQQHGGSQAPPKPSSKSHTNQKQAAAPKSRDLDVDHPQEFTAIFDVVKHDGRDGYTPTSKQPKRSTSPTTTLPKQKTCLVSLRLCFGSDHAVKE